MSKADLMRQGAEAGEGQFPDTFDAGGGTRLRLQYRLEPGAADDGVTAVVPLAALNQLNDARFDWLVPGLLREKVEALIRSLPKSLRTQFVPVPDVAAAAAAVLKPGDGIEPGDGSLVEALAAFLGRRGTAAVPASANADLRAAGPPADELRRHRRGREGAWPSAATWTPSAGRWGSRPRQSFADLPRSEFNRDDVRSWDFGDLPEVVEVRRHGTTLSGYPALVDRGTSVSLRLLDSPQAAAASHRLGLRRLFMLKRRAS